MPVRDIQENGTVLRNFAARAAPKATTAESPATRREGHRDTVEAIVVAFILALVVRGFEAQAFVIPTGSMAPTLMGRHKELACPECEFVFALNASEEVEPRTANRELRLYSGLCSNCRFQAKVEALPSFKGDRILVMMFPYDLPFLPGSAPPGAMGRCCLPLSGRSRGELHQTPGGPAGRDASHFPRGHLYQIARRRHLRLGPQAFAAPDRDANRRL